MEHGLTIPGVADLPKLLQALTKRPGTTSSIIEASLASAKVSVHGLTIRDLAKMAPREFQVENHC